MFTSSAEVLSLACTSVLAVLANLKSFGASSAVGVAAAISSTIFAYNYTWTAALGAGAIRLLNLWLNSRRQYT